MTPTFLETFSNVLPQGAARFRAPSSSELSPVLGHASDRGGAVSQMLVNLQPLSCTAPLEWEDTAYRHAALEATIESMVAWQVRVNREERGLTQAELATAMGTGQSAISKLEDPEGGDVLLSTLVRAAHAFDCAVLVRFMDHHEFASQTADVRPEHLFACSYSPAASLAARPRSRKKVAHGSSTI